MARQTVKFARPRDVVLAKYSVPIGVLLLPGFLSAAGSKLFGRAPRAHLDSAVVAEILYIYVRELHWP